VLGGFAVAAALAALAGCADDKTPPGKNGVQETPTDPYEVVQEFPSKGPMETAWKVRWGEGTSKGLYLTGAWFKRNPKDDWIKVLGDTRASDIFVPYHGANVPGFENTRFWDLSTAEYQFELKEATESDAGPHGQLLGNPPKVVKEVRDTGLLWKEPRTGASRRGEQLVLWGTMRAANYAYVFQYAFRDDGGINVRLGATGQNYPHAPLESHVHNALWRIDVDLAEPKHNTVYVMRHLSPSPEENLQRAEDRHDLFSKGKEGWEDWKPEEFTMLRVVDPRRHNYMGEPWGYDLMPIRNGTARFKATEFEKCTLHDFYVTRSPHADGKPDDELDFKRLLVGDDKHPPYVNGEDITDTDVVIWYVSSAHHEPRSEDGRFVQDKEGNYRWQGITLLMWTGFDLMPHNFIDGTPLYHPTEE
jgi:hypothetical protein